MVPYSMERFYDVYHHWAGEARLSDGIEHNGCMFGVVTRQFNENCNEPDVSEIFDSKSEASHLITDLLVASSAAPLFLDAPFQLGGRNYIDGGVAGNFLTSAYNIAKIRLKRLNRSLRT